MMKINNLLTRSFVALIMISMPMLSFAAECDSINDELSSKFRFLGNWDQKGVPLYLEIENDEVSDALIDYVNATLPESVKVPGNNDDYFGDDVQLNTELKEKSKVYLTMVHEGAGWTNTLGFYTYSIDNPPQTVYDIDSLVVIFPNVTQTSVVQPGNKVLLGEFPAETGIGYFLIVQGWVGDTICLASHMVFTDTYLNTFTTPEYQQQTILLNYQPENQLLLCFEDIKRPGGDNDFNDAVFYVTAEPGAIDTTNIPVIPTAQLSGDTTLCGENDIAELTLNFTGKAPWSITITNGIEEQSLNEITEKELIVETLLKDSIWIKSFSDVRKPGVKSGYALVEVSNPGAVLNAESTVCSNSETEGGYLVQLEGIAPFSITYSLDGEEVTIDDINENQYELMASVGQEIQLISMSDQYCDGSVSDGIVAVRSLVNPTLSIQSGGVICEGEEGTNLQFELTGEGPWTVNYLLNDQELSVDIENTPYEMNIQEATVLEITSVSDANCSSTILQTINIEQKSLPSAQITNYSFDCGDEAASIEIGFEGEGPWFFDYKLNEELFTVESSEASLQLNVENSGLMELVKVQDSYCERLLEEVQEISVYGVPSAEISGDASICNGEEATIQIALSGNAPFEIVYSDGENEITVETEETLYEFKSSEFGTYTLVSVTDANCDGTVEGSATITDGSEDLNVEIDASDNSCFGEDIALELIGETDNLTITWTTEGGGTLANTDQLNTSYTPAANESGDVVFYAEVTNGCAIKTISKSVTIIEELSADFDISPENDLLTNTQITFTPDQNGYDEYIWDFGDDTGSTASVASTEYVVGGVYDVSLTVVKNGCEAESEAQIEVLSKDELFIPNAFHPYAQNPENQVVKVYGNNIDDNDFYFKIVNRWGKVMYETSSFNEANSVGWDGVNNNTNEEQELNVFTYIVRGRFIAGESFEKTGTITQVK